MLLLSIRRHNGMPLSERIIKIDALLWRHYDCLKLGFSFSTADGDEANNGRWTDGADICARLIPQLINILVSEDLGKLKLEIGNYYG